MGFVLVGLVCVPQLWEAGRADGCSTCADGTAGLACCVLAVSVVDGKPGDGVLGGETLHPAGEGLEQIDIGGAACGGNKGLWGKRGGQPADTGCWDNGG